MPYSKSGRVPGDPPDARELRNEANSFKLWINWERTILFRLSGSSVAQVLHRDSPAQAWGEPVQMTPEGVDVPVSEEDFEEPA